MSTHDVISSLAAAEAAQINVERAKLGVEHARGLLEAARALEGDAKAKLEDAYAQAETLGISRKAFKEVVAERVATLVGSGLLSLTPLAADEEKAPAQAPADAAKPRAPRARKSADAQQEPPQADVTIRPASPAPEPASGAANADTDAGVAPSAHVVEVTQSFQVVDAPAEAAVRAAPEAPTHAEVPLAAEAPMATEAPVATDEAPAIEEAPAAVQPIATAIAEDAPEAMPEPAPVPAPAAEAPRRPATPSFLLRGGRAAGAPSSIAIPGVGSN